MRPSAKRKKPNKTKTQSILTAWSMLCSKSNKVRLFQKKSRETGLDQHVEFNFISRVGPSSERLCIRMGRVSRTRGCIFML